MANTKTRSRTGSGLLTFAALVGVVAVLYVAKDLLFPLALAAFISLLLYPLLTRLEKTGLPRIPAVILIMIVASAPVATVGWVVTDQFIEVARMLPQYKDNIQHKIETIRGSEKTVLEQASETLEELGTTPPGDEAAVDETRPLPVTIKPEPPTPIKLVKDLSGPVLGPLTTLGIVIVFVIFILIQWEDVRDRLIHLISRGNLTLTTQALTELSERIGRYLRMQFLLNVCTGAFIAVSLWIIGVPNAILWGFLGAALRFVPYAGAIVSALLPIFMTIAISDDWTLPLKTAGFFLVFELISNNIIEPYFYGQSTGISMVALLVAAVFWSWLWGLGGLLLSTQMTVCLVVLGRYVPALAFLDILLGDQPVLQPPAKLYQRLLAGDYDEATEVLEAYLKDHTLAETFDTLLVPVLRKSDDDLAQEFLDESRCQFIQQSVMDLSEEAVDIEQRLRAERAAGADEGEGQLNGQAMVGPPAPRSLEPRTRVLCLPARDTADAIAAHMLAVLLAREHIMVRNLDLDDMGTDLDLIFQDFKPSLFVISAVPPFATAQARLRAIQIHRKWPEPRIILGLWGVDLQKSRVRARIIAAGAASAVGSLAEAVSELSRITPSREPAWLDVKPQREDARDSPHSLED